ncbi:glycosyltransferase family 4 protein [Natrialbaceae archaeon A-CW3]
MKVLQLVTSPRPFFDQQVSTLEARGVECTVLSVPGEYRGDSTRGPLDYARYYPQVLGEIRSGEYDIIHANYGLVAPFALAQPKRPVVLTLWGTDLMSDQDWLRTISHQGARFADAVVSPSPAISDALEVDHDLIPFGVDTERFRPLSKADARERIGWDTDEPIALFPYDPSRGVKDYPRARRLLERVDAEVELRAITGVPHEEIPLYMNASDLLLVTSKRESGPMVVKEAAACNVPIVSTDVGFVRETIGDVTGCVVSDDDATLVDGIERAAETSIRPDARGAIDGLSLESMGDSLHELYRDLLEGRVDGSADQAAGVAQRV